MALLGGDAAGAMTTLARLAKAEAKADAPLPAPGLDPGLARPRRGPARARRGARPSATARSSSWLGPGSTRAIPSSSPPATTRPNAAPQSATPRRPAASSSRCLDRTLLAHGYPAIGEAHPLLARARALAARLGLAVPGTVTADLDEVSLDIDV